MFVPYLCVPLAALGIKTLMEQLKQNFSVAAPASLELTKNKNSVALARQLYLHYMGTTHIDKTQAVGLKNVSISIR